MSEETFKCPFCGKMAKASGYMVGYHTCAVSEKKMFHLGVYCAECDFFSKRRITEEVFNAYNELIDEGVEQSKKEVQNERKFRVQMP